MIAAIWPGDTACRRAQVADWRKLPLPSGAARQVIGDGALNAVPDRTTLRAILGEVRRILAPGGRAAIRCFLRPGPSETLDAVLQAARDGRIASLNVLRWRIASALAVAPGHEVAVADILSATAPLGDLAEFARKQDMDPDQAEHFLAYRASPARYVFPDRVALEADAASAGLRCTWVPTAGYPGAEDCPIALLS
jgi:SAM-dependent methyltransferase